MGFNSGFKGLTRKVVENYVCTKKNGYVIPLVQQCGLGLSVSIKMLKHCSDQYLPFAFILTEGTRMLFYAVCYCIYSN